MWWRDDDDFSFSLIFFLLLKKSTHGKLITSVVRRLIKTAKSHKKKLWGTQNINWWSQCGIFSFLWLLRAFVSLAVIYRYCHFWLFITHYMKQGCLIRNLCVILFIFWYILWSHNMILLKVKEFASIFIYFTSPCPNASNGERWNNENKFDV